MLHWKLLHSGDRIQKFWVLILSFKQSNIIFPAFQTDRFRRTGETQIRLFLEKQSDHSLQHLYFCLHRKMVLLCGCTSCLDFRVITKSFEMVQKLQYALTSRINKVRIRSIGFYEDLTKIIFELSSNIIKYAPYLFCWLTMNKQEVNVAYIPICLVHIQFLVLPIYFVSFLISSGLLSGFFWGLL